MISRNVGIAICRVGAVFLIVQTIRAIAVTLETFQASALAVPDFFSAAALITVGPAIGAVFLWVFAGRIASIGTAADEPEVEPRVDQADVIAAGTYLVGIYIAVVAFVDAVQLVALSTYPRLYPETAGLVDSIPNPHGFARQVGNAVQIILGIVLIVVGRRSR